MHTFDYDVLVIGGGTAGLSAYRKLLAEGWRVGLVEPNEITTTCANVGCMPSKLLIAAAEAAHTVDTASGFGIDVHGWHVNDEVLWERVRSERDRFVGFVSRGAASIPVIKGWAQFKDEHTVEVRDAVGRFKLLTAKAYVLATGSRPFIPRVFEGLQDEILTNENVFELKKTPKRIAVFGAGVIGVELGMAFKQLGSEVHMFNLGDKFLGLNPSLNEYWTQVLADSFNLHLRTRVESIEKLVNINGKVSYKLSYGGDPVIVDKLLVATGRAPNLELLMDSGLSVNLKDYDRETTRLGNTHLFLAGDVNNDIPLLHEASKEGELAAKSVSSYLRGSAIVSGKRLVPLSIVFTTPQVMSVGSVQSSDNEVVIGSVSFEDQGRSRVMRKNKGMAELYFDADTRKLIGAQMIGPDAEHVGHLLAWAITNGNTVDELVNMPFYHPVIEEGIRTAIRDAHAKFSNLT